MVTSLSLSHHWRSCAVWASADASTSRTPARLERQNAVRLGKSSVRDVQARSCSIASSFLAQRVQVAHQALQTVFQHVRIDLRGGDVGVPQQRLYDPQIGAVVQEVASEGVT